MRDSAYILMHESQETGDIKIIGLYSERDKAETAISRLSIKPGFRDDISGFAIEEYKFDEDNWIDGFITVLHEDTIQKP